MTLTLHLERTTRSARIARRAIQDLLDDHSPIAFLRDAILLTSELVSNVTLHTDGPCELRASFRPSAPYLRVEVLDESPLLPTLEVDRPRPAVGGLGMRLIDDVATSWGASALPFGKVVWFELGAT